MCFRYVFVFITVFYVSITSYIVGRLAPICCILNLRSYSLCIIFFNPSLVHLLCIFGVFAIVRVSISNHFLGDDIPRHPFRESTFEHIFKVIPFPSVSLLLFSVLLETCYGVREETLIHVTLCHFVDVCLYVITCCIC